MNNRIRVELFFKEAVNESLFEGLVRSDDDNSNVIMLGYHFKPVLNHYTNPQLYINNYKTMTFWIAFIRIISLKFANFIIID